jgi:hypothetical protein
VGACARVRQIGARVRESGYLFPGGRVYFAIVAKLKTAGLGVVGFLGVGCAPALSSFTPAHVAPKHHVQAEVGFDVSVPTGAINDFVNEAPALARAAHDHELTEDEQRRLFRAGAALALNPPSLVTHVGVAYTPLEHFEVGGRLSPGAWRLGTRYQLLEQELQSVDGTVSLGGGHYSYEFPLSDQVPLVKLEDFSRCSSTPDFWSAGTAIGTGGGLAPGCSSRSTVPTSCSNSRRSRGSRKRR